VRYFSKRDGISRFCNDVEVFIGLIRVFSEIFRDFVGVLGFQHSEIKLRFWDSW
jgi:hypothetical protein